MEEICCYTQGDKPMLYTIPFSHYCEAARWALTAAGVDFVEAAYLPGVHTFFSPIKKLRSEGGKPPADFTGSDTSVPFLVNADKEIVAYDAWQCMDKYGDAPTPKAKEMLDDIVGPCARTILYSHLLTWEGDSAFAKMCCHPRLPLPQRLLLATPPFRWKVTAKIQEDYIKSAEHVQECRVKLRDSLEGFEGFIYEPPFAGEAATVPGIALASLMAPLVMPPEYCISFYGEQFIELKDMPQSLQEEVNFWRCTPVGAWTLDYYRTHRCKAA